MKNKILIVILFISGMCFHALAQTPITGVVLDSSGKTILPYVNIGIKGKSIGTGSMADGTFTINIPVQNESDTLTFSRVGYRELNLPVKNIVSSHQKIFQMQSKPTEMDPVLISVPKLIEKEYGIKNNNALIHFTDGSTNQNDIFEIAQLVKTDTSLSKITSVNLYINETRNDSGTFRINFYSYDGNRPAQRIVEKNLLFIKSIKEGWLKFDVTKYSIYLKGNFIVAIEFIPTTLKNKPVYYEVKLGGSAKSFVRTSSQGEWNVPPHHYRLFVTVLVPDKNSSRYDDADERESTPVTALFSEAVQDSFSLFIHLPKNYDAQKNAKYPVIYLLDANAYFDIIADAMVEYKSNSILVAIGYKDFITMDSLRNRDYTYPEAPPQDSFPVSGGANRFLSFIRFELIPYIDKSYSTDTTNRTLMGHSLGGYFSLYAMQKSLEDQNSSFKNYVAASPSLDYYNSYLIKRYKEVKIENNVNPVLLFITYGGREDMEDGLGTEGLDNFNLFVAILSKNNIRNFNIRSQIYPKYGHMETAVPTFTKIIRELK